MTLGPGPKVTISRLRLATLPRDVGELAMASRAEGFRHIDRLIDDHRSGANTFSAPGECLFEARVGTRLGGVGGLSIDPFAGSKTTGRVRRMYVLPELRGFGVGRSLLTEIQRAAADHFAVLNLFTGTEAGARFYEALGFSRVLDSERVSHCKRL